MAGYNPASTLTGDLPQSTVIHYDKKFVENLKANTPFLRCCEKRELPANSGNQLRLYSYVPFAANTNPAGEGTVDSGIAPSVLTTTATIGQYADYVSFSDLVLETAIDPALENVHRELAYRLALSMNQLVRNTADGSYSVDGSVDSLAKDYNVPLVASDIRSAVQAMLGRNIKPFDKAQNRFCGVIHPFVVGDLLNDVTANGLTDILKRSVQGAEKLDELPGLDEVEVIDFAGATFYQSSMVKQTSNYLGHGGVTAFRTYLFGENGIIRISLGVKENAQIGEGDWKNISLYMQKLDAPSVADPSRMIGGFTSYNVKFVPTLPPDTVMRLRYIDAPSTIS